MIAILGYLFVGIWVFDEVNLRLRNKFQSAPQIPFLWGNILPGTKTGEPLATHFSEVYLAMIGFVLIIFSLRRGS